MAGLINIVPRYLPAYGHGAGLEQSNPPRCPGLHSGKHRDHGFNADVDAQAGAYATGILVMMVSGAVAVTISAARHRQRRSSISFTILTLVLLYALVENILEKPDGLTISSCFIAGIIAISLVSRISRTTELRADQIVFDNQARRFIADSLAYDGTLNLIANRPRRGTACLAPRRRLRKGE